MFSLSLVIIILRNIQTCLGDIIALLEKEEAKSSSPSNAPAVTREPAATETKPTFQWGENIVLSETEQKVPETDSKNRRDLQSAPTALFQLKKWDNAGIPSRCVHCTRPCWSYTDYCEYHQTRATSNLVGRNQGVLPGSSSGGCS
jgi:hypothetical protein